LVVCGEINSLFLDVVRSQETHINQLREFRLTSRKKLIQIFNSILKSGLSTSTQTEIPEVSIS
jgi:uncharacterized protein YdaT